jgi:hypothetical protein
MFWYRNRLDSHIRDTTNSKYISKISIWDAILRVNIKKAWKLVQQGMSLWKNAQPAL